MLKKGGWYDCVTVGRYMNRLMVILMVMSILDNNTNYTIATKVKQYQLYYHLQ